MTPATILRTRGLGGWRTGDGATLSAGGRSEGGATVVPVLNQGCSSSVRVIAGEGLAFSPLAGPGGVKRSVGAVPKLAQSASAEPPTDSGTRSAIGVINLAVETAPSLESRGGVMACAAGLPVPSLMVAAVSARRAPRAACALRLRSSLESPRAVVALG